MYTFIIVFPLLSLSIKDKNDDDVTIPKRIVPKILYSPNTTVTRSIMHKANITFSTIEFILSWLRQIDNCSQLFLETTNASSPVIVSIRNYANTILQTSGNNSTIQQIRLINQLLDPDNPNNLWNSLERVSATSQDIQGELLRLDWDIFYPVENQEKLVELATNMWRQKELNITSVFAGKVLLLKLHVYNCQFISCLLYVFYWQE